MSRQAAFIIIVVSTIGIAVLAFLSSVPAQLQIAGASVSLTSGAIIGLGYALGLAVGLTSLAARAQQQHSNTQALKQWQAQDDKLIAEVQSDREKQLEAKVATLEAALQRALKK